MAAGHERSSSVMEREAGVHAIACCAQRTASSSRAQLCAGAAREAGVHAVQLLWRRGVRHVSGNHQRRRRQVRPRGRRLVAGGQAAGRGAGAARRRACRPCKRASANAGASRSAALQRRRCGASCAAIQHRQNSTAVQAYSRTCHTNAHHIHLLRCALHASVCAPR